ncbi:MAG: primosomal protein N' [Selenomonadaceae bacterium]|nr:primosomal protein N' [Selenomonadaceae bacterium]
MRIADVAVNIPLKSIAKAYSYRIPEEFSQVEVGWRVFVPFGQRRVEGFVLGLREEDSPAIELKDIIGLVDEEGWFSPPLIAVCRELADFYLCSLAEIMRLFMPGKSGLKIGVTYAAEENPPDSSLLTEFPYAAVYDLIRRRQAMSLSAIKQTLSLDDAAVGAAVKKMCHEGLLSREYSAKRRGDAKYETYVSLGDEVTPEMMADLKRKPAQRRLVEFLREQGEQSLTVLRGQKFSSGVIKALVTGGFIRLAKRRRWRDSYEKESVGTAEDSPLTPDQQTALRAIAKSLTAEAYQGFLLHGVTGSGKTRVYIEAVKKTRERGRQAIVLVPEIALTGQLVTSFQSYFPQDIAVFHSRLSVNERNDAILRVRRGEAGIVIGARSALFTPLDDVGIIILDEEQDTSYKQDESPRYHARVVAEMLAVAHGAVLILGSATPSLETFYRARQGELKYLTMPKRIGDVPLPEVRGVDMRQELKAGNRRVLSRPLQQLITATLEKHEQLIIMLNRRGYATFVMCRSCGEALKCAQCGMPLVYHRDGRLLCHHCDISEAVPSVCPKCGSRYIKYFGSGTEKLEQELKELVPQGRIIRMDRDTTTGKFAHQEILAKFRQGEYDILLGTQMVAKGHDVSGVTAVGIVSADSGLNMPDFRASERVFMLITQTAGRAGRRDRQGRVVVQSYSPEHYAVTCGLKQDYAGFYAKEIARREELFYPPFSRLVKLIFRHEKAAKAKDNAQALAAAFQKKFAGDTNQRLIGPSPAIIACLRGIYRFVVLIKTADLATLREFLREEEVWRRDDVAVDIDPITML